ncbi:MAG TPA: pyridoxamine 5'-phosphate oxidase family protein [Gaiellaceae bacterium]|nr:pyridoxamine 5'-phosphate oxidase family protein [Gaiellaceae bacterium]
MGDPRSELDVDELLARPLFAHLATASDDGPRDSPVWFLWEEDAIWIIGSRRTDTFPARLEREPRCAMGIVDFDREGGLVHHVGMRGRATLEPFDPQRAMRLLARYLSKRSELWDDRFRATLADPDNLFVRFVPETVVARDQSYDAAPQGGEEPS